MVPSETLRMHTEAEIGREIIRLVPHWYEAECGPEQHSIPIGQHTAHFYNHCTLSPRLVSFLAGITARTRELPLQHFTQLPGLIDVLLESFTIEWLRLHSGTTDWAKLVRYLESAARRTFENHPLTLNLLIREGTGTGDLTEPYLQKFFDRLASSPFSYLTVDPNLRLMDYGEVEWTEVQGPDSCKFYPDFLQPIQSVMQPGDISAHLTALGDIIIMGKAGLLAARRQRKWKVYDARDFKDSLTRCLGNPHVSDNLLDVIFDLSFRRQGALLIYDRKHRMRERILNSESITFSGWRNNGHSGHHECGQSLVGRLMQDTPLGRPGGSSARKRRLVEMAAADGAMVFDDDRLLAIGALVRSHPGVGSQLGARTTAARSSYLWGAHPIKISSDGDVTIYFRSRNGKSECDAVMNFL